MGKNSKSRSRGTIDGFIDQGTHIQGELHFEDTFRIDGKVTGKVFSRGELIVGEDGEVDGEIHVRKVFISGTVRGTVEAFEHLEITSQGRVIADLHVPALTMESGAFFEGRCVMKNHPSAEKVHSKGDGSRGTVTQMPVAT